MLILAVKISTHNLDRSATVRSDWSLFVETQVNGIDHCVFVY